MGEIGLVVVWPHPNRHQCSPSLVNVLLWASNVGHGSCKDQDAQEGGELGFSKN
jgi:hypothetical protein